MGENVNQDMKTEAIKPCFLNSVRGIGKSVSCVDSQVKPTLFLETKYAKSLAVWGFLFNAHINHHSMRFNVLITSKFTREENSSLVNLLYLHLSAKQIAIN